VGFELFQADGQTDRHDEASSCFSQFCECVKEISKLFMSIYQISWMIRAFIPPTLIKNVEIDHFIVPNQIRFISFISRKVQLSGDMPGKGEVACKEEMSFQLKICLEAPQQQTQSHSWLPGCNVTYHLVKL
jgi:hypothetical protein